jgi:hypothetical protein
VRNGFWQKVQQFFIYQELLAGKMKKAAADMDLHEL